MKRKLLLLFLICSFLIPSVAICDTSDTEHDADLKEVFFGKGTGQADTEELIVLQWAAYFALDCIASQKSCKSDKEGLAILKSYGIEGVPDQVSAFQYDNNQFTNQHHERYTHLGWDLNYANDPNGDLSNWETLRKPLLINAVRQVFLNGKKDLWSTVDFTGWFHQPKTDLSEQQVKSMAALIYYVHVLGDHCYNTYSTSKDRIPLVRKTENESNPSLIFDLKKHLQILFGDQTSSSEYRVLIAKMDSLHSELRMLLGNNDFPMPDQYDAYRDSANDLMGEIKKRIPRLLEDSTFFTTIFLDPAA